MASKSKRLKLRDFDPESLLDPAPSSSSANSDSESADDAYVGREHYADVGKSKLRKRDAVPLGPQYKGSRISRDNILDDDSDDPFSRAYKVGNSDEGLNSFNANKDGLAIASDESGKNEDMDNSVEDIDESIDAGQSDDKEDVEDEVEEDVTDDEPQKQGQKLRDMMNQEQKAVTATISHAIKADIQKGEAVKSQRKIFDTLLNARIRLQKALISTNSLTSKGYNDAKTDGDAIEAAETAALNLLSTLTNLRSTLDAARTGQKRKRSVAFTSFTPSTEIRNSVLSTDSSNWSHRRGVLNKWSQKTKSTSLVTSSQHLNMNTQQSITDVLGSHLSDSTRLIKRTHVPRSCAPIQLAAGLTEAEEVYDDADFYGLLLKELLEQHSQDSNGSSEFVVQTPWQASREAKSKKAVDTKASKGRKLRYIVHEKLQNFMAPEDRGTWGDRQRDELFGSLFGNKMGLGEELNADAVERSDEGDAEANGLLLFRN